MRVTSTGLSRLLVMLRYFKEFATYSFLSVELYNQMTLSDYVENSLQEAIRHESKIVPVPNLSQPSGHYI
jgi:hypothetical protein